jgi:hypothetical protein
MSRDAADGVRVTASARYFYVPSPDLDATRHRLWLLRDGDRQRAVFSGRIESIKLARYCVGGLALVFGTITVMTPSW